MEEFLEWEECKTASNYKCVCVHAHAADEHRQLLVLPGSIFDPTSYSCKHKYLSTKRNKGVDRQLLIMNQFSAGPPETSVSGIKGHG